MFLKKSIRHLSLQWRLTLMTAAVAALACIALTFLMGRSANTKMDEITSIFVEDGGDAQKPVSLEDIDFAPEYLEKLNDSKHTFQTQSIFAMLCVIFASSLLTYFITGKSFRQLKDFSECIEQIQAQNLSSPLDAEDFPAEIRRLSLSFNQMLGRLEQSFTAQKQFSANAAHELRTPLAVMQAKIEVFQKMENHSTEEYREVLAMLATQIERLSSIVNELLEMTTLQTAERTDEIVLQELVEEVLCDLTYQADQKNITLVQAEGDACFIGNETLMYRAIFNLVENAIKYNRPGGKVTVSLGRGNSVFLTVSDTGLGIPEEYQDSIFTPFFRVDKSRSREMGGAGIGLAMVEMIAKLHGGTVYVESSSPMGSQIRMELSGNPE